MRRESKPELVLLALVAYVPFLLSSPGRVSADSKQYLYLDPARFLGRVVDLWDPTIGAGTVPHQHLGYAVPVGPFYWIFDQLGVPDWVAQRLWLGTLTFLAAAGARWLFQQLGVGRVGALAGALVYGLTPYQLAFTARISVLLLPWVALPWLVGLTMRASRTRDWRAPAAFGLVVVAAGGINASSLLLVGLGPLLWLVLEAARGREGAVAALRTAGALGVVAGGVSLWWLVGLRLQGVYGLPVLQLTENVATVAERSSPGDLLRGLGNWFFYGRDASGYSLEQTADYESNAVVVVLSYAIPVLGLVAALAVRWTHRAYFGLLVIVGVVVAVGSWPRGDPSAYGSVWEAFTTDTSLGLAFRNSPRAAPLIVLGFAGLLAAAVGAVPRGAWERVAGGGVAVVALGALLPVWPPGGYLSGGLDRPEDIPAYWDQAVADIDAGDHGTRVLEVPGSTFAAYRWGNLVDPVTPGLTDRPYLAREVLPYGTGPSINLLDAFDRRIQLGIVEPASIAPVARLFGVGTISLRADLEQSDRRFSPPPDPLWRALRQAPGLAAPRSYGPPGGEGTDPDLPSVALFDIEDPEAIVRTAPQQGPTVLAGDGDGIVDAAAAGLIDGRELLLYGSALDDAQLAQALADDAHLVLTDSNRRRIQTWFYALRDTRGPTERAGVTAPDPSGYDFRLDPFPGTGDDSRTVVEQVGGRVETSGEGGPDRPEDRGAHALDGDLATAWRVGGPNPVGQSITLALDEPLAIDRVQLVQPISARFGRAMTQVRVFLGDAAPIEVELGPESLTDGGQTVLVPEQVVAEVRVEVRSTAASVAGDLTPVGLAELGVGATRVAEIVRLPVDLLARVGAAVDGHSLDVVLTRLRQAIEDDDRGDDEAHLDRRFELPVARTFSVTGLVRSPTADAPPVELDVCRDDLLRIDDRPVSVRLTSGPAVDAAGGMTLEACRPVRLAAGSHRLVAEPGFRTGLDVDRLILSTDAAGAPASLAARTDPRASPPARVVEDDATRLSVEVEAGADPFWLVLGQSASEGWTASVDGAEVGERTLVDGYANGWLITPEGPGTIAVELRWGPQRLVWAAMALSAAVAIGCVVVLVRGRGRPRPAVGDGGRPTLGPWRRDHTEGAVFALAAAGLVGLGTAAVATPTEAIVAAALTVAAGLVRGGRMLLWVAAPAALVLSRLDERPFLAWLAVALLAADLLLGRRDVRERSTPA